MVMFMSWQCLGIDVRCCQHTSSHYLQSHQSLFLFARDVHVCGGNTVVVLLGTAFHCMGVLQ